MVDLLIKILVSENAVWPCGGKNVNRALRFGGGSPHDATVTLDPTGMSIRPVPAEDANKLSRMRIRIR